MDTYTTLNIESTVSGENVLHLKVKGLILDTIHHLSVVDELINSRVSSVDEWEWQRRIRFEPKNYKFLIHFEKTNVNNNLIIIYSVRFYSQPGGEISIRMVDSEFRYSYEYQGVSPKLVHTPLTDNCYLTLTQVRFNHFS